MKMLSIVTTIKNKVLSLINSKDTLCYSERLNKVLISQTHNPLFYQGNVSDGGKSLTKEVTNAINTDRCSIWLYNKDMSSIVCEQLYVKAENKWYEGIELFEKDFKPYFDHLKIDPIIIANNAETHSATSCFTESYLKPLGVKSMLDVPIIYKGEVIGVICIENLTLRKWETIEVHFAQILSSLYTFAYSVKETNKLSDSLIEFDKFVDASVLVSKADSKGKITYVNKKFENVSGWKLEEVVGKDHNIVNSGEHSEEFWANMYKTVIKEKNIWNAIVTNKNKNGDLYWVDSYIKAEFDDKGVLAGFMSIRYDITDVIKKTKEIEESYYNNYDFTGRPYYIDELEIVDKIWEPKGKKKED
ncbi:MAG: PAS domain S-box protein [Caulobacteraceae bacterium]|nr:PAS domain S-box protein [Caulobacteraceae bacterium]